MNRSASEYLRQITRVLTLVCPASGLSRLPRVCFVLLFSILLLTGKTEAESQDDEYRVKAAFLFHFAQMVEWPLEALREGDPALFLCTIGDDPFQGKLERTIEGKSIGSRVLRIRHLTQTKDIQACQILFIGKDVNQRMVRLLDAGQNASVMTVGETNNFIDQGGILGFTQQDNKFRFEINLDAAGRSKLKISSLLLLLAKRVVGNNGGGR